MSRRRRLPRAARSISCAMRPPAERVEDTERAIALAERVIAANPEHPGGIHYLIHATDSPRFAARGLAAARIYDKLAPDADHALHMPSHIYLQLGMWPDVSASNERAWAASRAWVARGKHGLTELGWHSLEWLEYGYLQEGRYREARALVDTARQILAGASAEMLAGKPDARYAAEMRRSSTARKPATGRSLPPRPPMRRRWRLSRSARRRLVSARWPRRPRFTWPLPRWAGTTSMRRARAWRRCGRLPRPCLPAIRDARRPTRRARNWTRASPARAAISAAAVDQLTRLSGAARDAGLSPVGFPMTQPLTEMLAAALFDARRFAEAAAVYERALAERPNRSAALLGLARAKTAAGDAAGATAAYARLAANWKRADPKVKALVTAALRTRP